MDKTSIRRFKPVARSLGLPLACVLVGLCGGCLLKKSAYPGWFQKLSETRFAALAGIPGGILGSVSDVTIAFIAGDRRERVERRNKQIERREEYRQKHSAVRGYQGD
ncbi:MAG: hypothetical protein MUQ10_19865 [Anaerolineae bacterium]|nr:hypothetical protein [Anaerolineae bacterium]